MCNRCTQAWLPMNHRRSHPESWGDKFHWRCIFRIRNPLAEMRRLSKLGRPPTRIARGGALRTLGVV